MKVGSLKECLAERNRWSKHDAEMHKYERIIVLCVGIVIGLVIGLAICLSTVGK
jgi:hypothetical protein